MSNTEELLSTLQRRQHLMPAAALDPDDQDRLQYLRGATRDTRRKIESLESELFNREKAYEAEVALRKSLEQRLSSRLVDMYSSQSLNDELQQRLPRAAPRTAPFRFVSEDLTPLHDSGGLLMTSPTLGAPLVLSPVSLPLPPAADRDRSESRQLSTLLSELENVKDENRRLQARLIEAQKDAEEAKTSIATARGEIEAMVAAEVADTVKEIHAAQKSRDEAMMVRLRIANDERDAALTRLHENENKPEDEIKPQNIQYENNRYAPSMEQPPRDKVDANEVDSIRQERDAAIFKFQQLQQEYNSLKRSNLRLASPSPGLEVNTELIRVKKERDEAIRKLNEVEDEMQTLRVYYSLHKSLSPEMVSNQASPHDSDLLRSQNAALQNRVHSLSSEIEAMSRELQDARDGHEKAEAEVMNLNRLVGVLRRKLNQSERGLVP